MLGARNDIARARHCDDRLPAATADLTTDRGPDHADTRAARQQLQDVRRALGFADDAAPDAAAGR